MSDLVVIAFPTEAKAEEVRQKLLAMQKEYLIELGDAVVHGHHHARRCGERGTDDERHRDDAVNRDTDEAGHRRYPD